ncbi:MAG: alpha/beta hydrolase family protein [Planctomycetaceae bacterium]
MQSLLRFAIVVSVPSLVVFADDKPAKTPSPDLKTLLGRRVIDPALPVAEVQAYTESRVPRMPKVSTVAEWERHAKTMRQRTLREVVFRGEAAGWRTAKSRVQWLEALPGNGYRIRKLRYEALPGLWVPALLYEPSKLTGQVPVVLNVNGHDRGNGKAARYKQVRCINQVKRGMLALNVEWWGMGQLATPGFSHYRLNQIDLCGSSGVAPFYLAMKRGIDVLLSHKHADPKRVAVAGLSGGGWQTIFISALDERVTLSNPVAGYSSFRTRARFLSDLGDSEQTPVDLAVTADYAQLTAMRAPRPTLLTNNANDNCCFKAEHALPPLVEAAQPIFNLYGKPANLRTHVNYVPGNHNFEKENREALYAFLGKHFYKGQPFDPKEIPCDDEVKTKAELTVAVPKDNLDFHKIALQLSRDLPRDAELPRSRSAAIRWQNASRDRLRKLLRIKPATIHAIRDKRETHGDTTATYWWLRVDGEWTVPGVEIVRGKPTQGTAVVLADKGRANAAETVESLLKRGCRVLAVDPFYFGESKIARRDFLYGLLISAVGKRPLGVQAGQVAAIAGWLKKRNAKDRVTVVSAGPRTSLIALCAGGLQPTAIDGLELHDSFAGLKQVLEQDLSVNKTPELFCFGLLEQFDVKQLAALAAPRPVRFVKPTKRHRKELAGLRGFYKLLRRDFDPLADR